MIRLAPRGASVRGPRLAVLPVATLAALAASLSATPSAAQADYVVSRVEVNQLAPHQTVRLVAGKPTMVRATVIATGGTPAPVDGLLRVINAGPQPAVFSTNGPIVPLTGPPDPNDLGDTLNFVFIPPASGALLLTVEVNPLGPNYKVESNAANNLYTTAPFNFEVQAIPEHIYVPIDYRPFGGDIPNLPPLELIKPGVGDNFVQAIYPSPDWNYHRSVAPSKLWTSSVSGSGSALNSALVTDALLAIPVPDFIYGWVPGGLSYNGQSIINGMASMGNTEPIRLQRTFAHELGHNFGMSHNNLQTGVVGIDVEHQLNETEDLPQLHVATQSDIMVAGLLTSQAWQRPSQYLTYFDQPEFQTTDAATYAEPTLLVNGLWNPVTGVIDLADVVAFMGGRRTEPVPYAEADLLVRAYAGGSLRQELYISARTGGDCGDSADSWEMTDPTTNVVIAIAAEHEGARIERLVIVDPAASTKTAPVELRRSATPPALALTTSVFEVDPAGTLTLAWEASDADGDALTYYVRYSPDGTRMVPLATRLTATSLDVDLAGLPLFVDGQGFFEVLASDGLDTTRVQSPALSSAGGTEGAGNPPFVDILTPDAGYTYMRGATVVLHGAAWDIDDLELGGADLVWRSNLDGQIGTGRVTSTGKLKAGNHTITLEGTDSSGNTVADTVSITVTARGLPFVVPVCGKHLGHGMAVFTLCQPPLASTATMNVIGAAPNQAAWLLGGPTDVPGATLLPSPITLVLPLELDASGALSIEGLPGEVLRGLVWQVLYVDPTQSQGFGFTNGVRF